MLWSGKLHSLVCIAIDSYENENEAESEEDEVLEETRVVDELEETKVEEEEEAVLKVEIVVEWDFIVRG
jgi:hypothetical protein